MGEGPPVLQRQAAGGQDECGKGQVISHCSSLARTAPGQDVSREAAKTRRKGRELKLAVYNSFSLTKAQATQVARAVASKYRKAGVKNVTYEVNQGMPSVWTGLVSKLGRTPHSHFLELRPSRSGAPATRKGRVGQNWEGHSAVDASSAVQQAGGEESKVVTGVSNIGAHEVAHDVFWLHPGNPGAGDLMRGAAAGDMNWLFDPNLEFTPEQAETLRRHYNRSGEVETVNPQQNNEKEEGNKTGNSQLMTAMVGF